MEVKAAVSMKVEVKVKANVSKEASIKVEVKVIDLDWLKKSNSVCV